jgi:hypothetical protein
MRQWCHREGTASHMLDLRFLRHDHQDESFKLLTITWRDIQFREEFPVAGY